MAVVVMVIVTGMFLAAVPPAMINGRASRRREGRLFEEMMDAMGR